MSRSPTAAPSGLQFTLELGRQAAVVTEVGAGLRRYTVDARDVLDGYAADEMCSGARGQTFIPWPNRIADGRYSFDGAEHQLPLTEPPAGNAIHGLTRWANWHVAQANGHSVRLQLMLRPQPGYPFHLRCELAYRLSGTGLTVETSATNVGPRPCPYATGAHPYLSAGAGTIDALTVRLPADTYYPTDDRGIPVAASAVEDTPFDLRHAQPLGDRAIDNAFTGLRRDDDGWASVVVTTADGVEVTLRMDAAYRYVEIFTGDTLPEVERRRRGLDVEPMTCAPNAFRTGDGLLTLAPGETHTATWELQPAL
jgi:aldose 1-epimerase